MLDPADLPKAIIGEERLQQYCDTCYKKGQGNVLAVSYCTDETCKKRYCAKHKQVGNSRKSYMSL